MQPRRLDASQFRLPVQPGVEPYTLPDPQDPSNQHLQRFLEQKERVDLLDCLLSQAEQHLAGETSVESLRFRYWDIKRERANYEDFAATLDGGELLSAEQVIKLDFAISYTHEINHLASSTGSKAEQPKWEFYTRTWQGPGSGEREPFHIPARARFTPLPPVPADLYSDWHDVPVPRGEITEKDIERLNERTRKLINGEFEF